MREKTTKTSPKMKRCVQSRSKYQKKYLKKRFVKSGRRLTALKRPSPVNHFHARAAAKTWSARTIPPARPPPSGFKLEAKKFPVLLAFKALCPRTEQETFSRPPSKPSRPASPSLRTTEFDRSLQARVSGGDGGQGR